MKLIDDAFHIFGKAGIFELYRETLIDIIPLNAYESCHSRNVLYAVRIIHLPSGIIICVSSAIDMWRRRSILSLLFQYHVRDRVD